ncbi:universal stress protein [Halorubrum salsamenti]|uniref:universal stress protein n=1 Tax=Halorubrum salsamenti TaxID=2583990 RepID=UPI0011AA5F5E|nr:universal stress protein [Halorubrum salsamenti]
MSEILFAIDDDKERVGRQVQTVVEDLPMRTEDLTVTVLHVFSDNPTGASIAQLQTARFAETELEAAGIDVELVGRSGNPSAEIIGYADEAGADLICLAGRKRSPTGKALFGSVTQDVILTTELPVLIAGDERT